MYVIAQPAGAKRARLYKTRRSGDKLLGTVPDHTAFSDQAPVVIKSSELIVSLGDSPPFGSVYGCLVEPVTGRFLVKGYGEVFNFVHKMSDVVRQRVAKALPIARARVTKLGPDIDWSVRTEIRTVKGTVGRNSYTYRPKAEEDVLVLRPVEGQSTRETVKIAAHEMAHGVWWRHMDASQRARWIQLFDRYVKVHEVSVRDVKVMISDMRQIEGIKPYMKDAEPEQQGAAEMYLAWLSKVHKMDKRAAQDLLTSGSDMPVPDTHIHRSMTETAITLYGKDSADELFCEALSSLVVGDLADSRIERMLGELKNPGEARDRREPHERPERKERRGRGERNGGEPW